MVGVPHLHHCLAAGAQNGGRCGKSDRCATVASVLASLKGSQRWWHLVGLCLFFLNKLVRELVQGRSNRPGRARGESTLQVSR